MLEHTHLCWKTGHVEAPDVLASYAGCHRNTTSALREPMLTQTAFRTIAPSLSPAVSLSFLKIPQPEWKELCWLSEGDLTSICSQTIYLAARWNYCGHGCCVSTQSGICSRVNSECFLFPALELFFDLY